MSTIPLRICHRLTVAFAALLACGCVDADASDSRAKPQLELTGRVVDAAEVLSPSVEAHLTNQLAQLESDELTQMVVVTTPSLDGEPINDYSLQLARSWGIGHPKRNDGLVLLVAPNERKVRIEVGYGLEPKLTNSKCTEIIEQMIPYFSKGDLSGGIQTGVDQLDAELRRSELRKAA